MLEKMISLAGQTDEELKEKSISLEADLVKIQQKIKNAKLPVIILIDGMSCAGKGEIIAKLISQLDPRFFDVRANAFMGFEEKNKPFLWKYWRQIPARGRILILDKSWYQETVSDYFGGKISSKVATKRVKSINTFERQLVDDGYLIIKIFLSIDKKEQKKRLTSLLKCKSTSYRVTRTDVKKNESYTRYAKCFDTVLERTSTESSTWHVINSKDKDFAVYEVFRTVVGSINAKLSVKANSIGGEITAQCEEQDFIPSKQPKLSQVNMTPTLSDEEYDVQLKKLRRKLLEAQNRMFRLKIPAVIGFEGWDAAGKGGAIKRLSSAFDPRGYDAVPICAPTSEELARHYLWRFWKELPINGETVIFDRTWYGRVMVEKLEKFTKLTRVNQAYKEINEFEKELYDSGTVIIKFWMNIDNEEQLRRFNERKNNPEKRWKITDEDWRNREKWDEYEKAVDKMILKTSTDFAPWNIIEGNDKKYARIKVMTVVLEQFEKAIKNKEKKQ